ncbi:MAG TPA: hypothetical protein VJT83_02785 [Chitinophagaceae bacterium]|nr:hypothetical protein [Chitinophagaceae bacterium]
MRANKKPFFPLLLIFILTNSVLVFYQVRLRRIGIDVDVALIGNVILLVATLLSFLLYRKSMQSDKPQKFLKFIYGGMFLKMLICLIAAFVYIVVFGKDVNKPALFVCMFLYFLYTFVEVSILLRLSKEQKNAQTGSTPRIS